MSKRQTGLTELEEVSATPNGLFDLPVCNYVENNPSSATTDVFTLIRIPTGGTPPTGTTLGTLTVVYDDASHTNLVSAYFLKA